MDWIDSFWPDDLSQVQWGPLSAWVGSLLTGLSLLLGFYILLRDRRKEERAQAQQLAAQYSFGHRFVEGRRIDDVEVHIHNGSTAAIFDIIFKLTPLSRYRIKWNLSNFDSEITRVEKSQQAGEISDMYVYGRAMQVLYEELPPKEFEGTKARDTIPPGETRLLQLDMALDQSWYKAEVLFTDIAGVRWVRDVRTYKLKKNERRNPKHRPAYTTGYRHFPKS